MIDVEQMKVIETLEPGKAVLHLEFTPRGEEVWISVRDEDRVEVYDTAQLRSAWRTLPAWTSRAVSSLPPARTGSGCSHGSARSLPCSGAALLGRLPA